MVKGLERKTPMQVRIEMAVTDGRGYSPVPYTKIIDEKSELNQWLIFSRVRGYRQHHDPKNRDKIKLHKFLPRYANYKIDQFMANLFLNFIFNVQEIGRRRTRQYMIPRFS